MRWQIEQTQYQQKDIADDGNRYLIGNGYMGVRGTLEEYRKEQLCAINLAGIYDMAGGWREPLNAPNALFAAVRCGKTDCALPQCEPSQHSHTLDYRHGIFGRKTIWHTKNGAITVEGERFACMHDPHLLAHRYTVTADFDGELTVTEGIDCEIWELNGPHYKRFDKSWEDGLLSVIGTAGEAGAQVAVCVHSQCDSEPMFYVEMKEKSIIKRHTCHMRCGESVVFDRFAAIFTSNDGAHPECEAAACALAAAKEGYTKVKRRHIARWEELWRISEVEIDGDDEARDALAYSLYHLHSIAPRHSEGLSIPARGLSGQTYKGAVFWDTEMFMLDFFLHTEPGTARSLVRYRVDTLAGAMSKAEQYGLDGAFYAWESQEGGADACSDYNVTDVFTGRPMRTYFRDKQIHISSAVAYAIMRYVDYTGDTALLAEGGARTVIECARFYRSCLVKRVNSERYELWDVIGPDEYHERVNNNAYTNRMAAFTFEAAVRVIQMVRQSCPDAYHTLCEDYDLVRESESFADARSHLYCPAQDPETGVIEQFDGYFALEDATVGELKQRLMHPKEYWGGAYGVASHTKVIKQADVAAMLALFADDYTDEIREQNFRYYEPKTEHGSSLSACMYALLACSFGQADIAYPNFQKSAGADLAGGGKQWAGLIYIGGTHPAAAGGAWMTVVRGFAGLRVRDGVLTVTPHLPEGWKRLAFSVLFGGQVWRVEISADGHSCIQAADCG